MKKITVWYLVSNCGDGSAFVNWYLTEKKAQDEYEKDSLPFAECCCGEVETFEGSNVHKKALKNG